MFPTVSAIAASMLSAPLAGPTCHVREVGEAALSLGSEPCADCRPRSSTEATFAALDFELVLPMTRKGHPALVALALRVA